MNCGFSEYERKTVNDNYLIYKAAEEWTIDSLWNFIFAHSNTNCNLLYIIIAQFFAFGNRHFVKKVLIMRRTTRFCYTSSIYEWDINSTMTQK